MSSKLHSHLEFAASYLDPIETMHQPMLQVDMHKEYYSSIPRAALWASLYSAHDDRIQYMAIIPYTGQG